MGRMGLVQTAPGRFEAVSQPAAHPQYDPNAGPSTRDLMAAQGETDFPDWGYMPYMVSPRALPPTYGRK